MTVHARRADVDAERRARELERLATLARLMDDVVRVPGTRIRLGLDPLLGLIPGGGDGVTAIAAGYIIVRAHSLGAPRRVLARMVVNVGLDFIVGLVPVAGDVLDVAVKANRRNVALLREVLEGD